MRQASIWKTLGISRTGDRTEIRRAYARKLKITNPEDNPEGFKILRAAYEQALAYADNRYSEDDLPEAVAAEPTDEAAPHAPDTADAAEPAPAVDDIAEAYFAAFNRLEQQLGPKSSAVDCERLASLDIILSSPMLDNIVTQESAELRLAQLVSRTRPRSDPLISRLINRFSWNNRRLDRHQPYAIRQVLQRDADLGFLRVVKRADDSNADAWHVLSRPPKPPSFWRRLWPKASQSDIANFLARIHNEHPTVIDDLNPEALQFWQARAQVRDLFDQIRVWAFVALPVALVVMLCTWISEGPHPILLAILAAVPVVSVSGALAYEYGYYRARRSWQENWRLQQNKWLAFGWGPGLVLLLALAAAPPSFALTIAVTALSVAVVWWAAITGEPDRSVHSWPWQIRLLVAELFLVAWWACALWDVPVPAAIQMTPAIIATTLVSGFGRMSLFESWLRFPLWAQRAGLFASLAGIIAATAFLWQAYAVDAWQTPATACAAIMIFLHRVPTLAIAHWTAGFRYVVTYGGLFIARTQGGEMMALAFAGSVLLLWAALNTGLAIYDTWRKPAG